MQVEKAPHVVKVTGALHKSSPKPALEACLCAQCLLFLYTATLSNSSGSEKEERWLVRKLGKMIRNGSTTKVSALTRRFLDIFIMV
jgi:hypothetical protein